MNEVGILVVAALSGLSIFVVIAMWSWVLKTKKKQTTSITSTGKEKEQ